LIYLGNWKFFVQDQIGRGLCFLQGMKTAIFLERDGILNLVQVERQCQVIPQSAEEFRINTEAAPLLAKLKAAGYLLIATTNQPGLSLGNVSRRELDRMHDLLRKFVPLDDILVCPHTESDECPCRKPRPGLLKEAAFKWHVDLEQSFIISDKWQDAQAARAVGCTSLLIKSPWIGSGHHDFVLGSLSEIVEKILKFPENRRPLAA
jgi:D-glycero-D-manno-heptose 1,7-bisphosphate phosphatase